MNDLRETINKYNLMPYKYKYINKACIIYTKNGNYVIKKKKRSDKDKLYDYLLSRDFSFFLYPENDLTDNYEIYSYLENANITDAEKAKDLMYIISDLHNRTTSFVNTNLDKIKEIYEDKTSLITYLTKYYNDLEDVFILRVYNSPAEYLLLRNIDKIYNTLEFSKILLDKWYEEISKSKKTRTALIHNHLNLDHFIANRDSKLINFDHAEYNSPIYDFIYFYKSHYNTLDMESLYNIYKHKFKYTLAEELLFFIELMLPWKIVFTTNNYNNCNMVYNLFTYLDVTRDFILEEQKKDKERYNHEKS